MSDERYNWYFNIDYIIMLQFGGGFPAEWGNPDVIELECMGRVNAVKIELKRIRE